MKTKRLATLALAGAMTMSLAAPAFAASTPAQDPNSTVVTGTYKAVTIDVVVTPTAQAFINPYGLDLEVSKDGSDITDSTLDADKVTISGQQIVTTPMSLQNKTAMDLSVGATMVGEVKEGSDMRLATAPVAASDTTKSAFVYLQAKQEASLTGAFGNSSGVDAAAIAAKYAAWEASAYNENTDVVLGTRDVVKSGLVTLAAADLSTPATPAANAGSVALFRLAGSCSTAPRGDGWTAADGFTANIAFTFAPAAKYTITLPAVGDFTITDPTSAGVAAPTKIESDATSSAEGKTVTITVTTKTSADKAHLTVTGADGTEINVTESQTGTTATFTFTMPAQDVVVTGEMTA